MNPMIDATARRIALSWKRLEMRPTTLALLCCLSVLVVAKGAVLWWHWSDQIAIRIEKENRTATSEAAIVNAFPARSDSIARIKRELIAATDSFIFAPTVAQTTTMTASLLADDAKHSGVRLGTIDIRPDSTLRDGIRFTTVDGDASGSYAEAISFIRLLDRGSPFFVKTLALSPMSTSGQPDELFHVRFGLVVFARRPFQFEQ